MMRAGLIAAGIACLTLTTAHADDSPRPALLQRLLQSQKTWRLLDPHVDGPPTGVTGAAASRSATPWIVADLDHDGRDDVAAVVVSGPPQRRRFGVVAAHAAAPRIPRWIVPWQAESILGVAPGPAQDTVEVDYCTECDTNPWYRWSGRGYEPGLFGTGDVVAIGDEHGADLLVRPLAAAATRAHVPPCAAARVHDVEGRAGALWYFVETTAEPRMRGWETARVVTASGDCSYGGSGG
jgi:hypothetical protein